MKTIARMTPGVEFTWQHAGILLGIVAGCVLITWLMVEGSKALIRHGRANAEAVRPAGHAVAATEAELMPEGFDLGRVA